MNLKRRHLETKKKVLAMVKEGHSKQYLSSKTAINKKNGVRNGFLNFTNDNELHQKGAELFVQVFLLERCFHSNKCLARSFVSN